MAIDPSIPLQVKRPEFINPIQAMSLRNLAQQFEMGQFELTGRRQQQQAMATLAQLGQQPGSFDEQGLPTPQFIQRVSSTPGLGEVGQEMAQRRLVTLRALATISSEDMQARAAAQSIAGKVADAQKELGGAAVSAYEQALQRGANEDEAMRIYTQTWQDLARREVDSGRLSYLSDDSRREFVSKPPPPSILRGQAMSLKDVTEQARRKEEAAARIAEQRESRRVREADIAGRAAEREDIRTEKKQLKQADAKVRVDTVTADLDAVARQAQRLLNHPGLSSITGTVMGRAPLVTNEQIDADSLLETLKSQAFINALASIREASKTGGAVGNVTEREGDKLESFRGSLRRLQSTDQLKSVLQDIINYADERKALVRRAYEESYPEEGGGAPAAPAPAAPARPAQPQAYKPLPDKNRISELEPGEVYQTPSGPGRFTGRFDAQGRPQFERPEGTTAGGLPRVKTNEEARKLPKGTRFIGPDGREYIR